LSPSNPPLTRTVLFRADPFIILNLKHSFSCIWLGGRSALFFLLFGVLLCLLPWYVVMARPPAIENMWACYIAWCTCFETKRGGASDDRKHDILECSTFVLSLHTMTFFVTLLSAWGRKCLVLQMWIVRLLFFVHLMNKEQKRMSPSILYRSYLEHQTTVPAINTAHYDNNLVYP
jgi:hypothetical protein